MQTEERRVLFVDDEQNVLDAVGRQLRRSFRVTTANGGDAGLATIDNNGPFPVVVSDFMMPGMNGVEFLGKAREKTPDAITIMLTGNADLSVAADAVNRGLLFRFLTKPCDVVMLGKALEDAFEQHRLRSAEKELLEQTLRGSIEVLAEVLALANPAAFGTALRVKGYVRQLAGRLKLADQWQFETAALLSQVGCVALPPELVEKAASGTPLTTEESSLHQRHPEVAKKLLGHIPRLGPVADVIAIADAVKGGRTDAAPLGPRLVGAALLFDELLQRGQSKAGALAKLKAREVQLGKELLAAFEFLEVLGERAEVRSVMLKELRLGMVFEDDVLLCNGIKVLSKGHEVTPSVLERLRAYAELRQLVGAIKVRVITHAAEEEPVTSGRIQ